MIRKFSSCVERQSDTVRHTGFMARLAHDRSGNTLALVAASILPLVGLVGSGIDMGRAYLASSRLQAACDAGVLAARKSLGTEAAVTGKISDKVAADGYKFFNLNFADGNYGTDSRDFTMALESDFAITGQASVNVPTSIMTVFGFDNVPVSVDCQALLSVSDLDVMMVLDVTGSMRHANDGDTLSRMDSMKSVIRDFHAQLETAKNPKSEIRYGFVPYATNVNVGHLLEDSWVTTNWTYQSREIDSEQTTTTPQTVTRNWVAESGTRTPWTTESEYAATYVPPTSGGTGDTGGTTGGYYSCTNSVPSSTWTFANELISSETGTDENGQPTTTEYYRRTSNGTNYRQIISGDKCLIQSSTDTNYVETFESYSYEQTSSTPVYEYKPIASDVTNWRTDLNGCIEERRTSEITDYDNVDITQNLDLDIDTVPTAGDSDTQWRPSNPNAIYARSFDYFGNGSFTPEAVKTTEGFAPTGQWWFSHCPARAQKLAPMTSDEVDTYLATLSPFGATYHDIGMIWGGRLMSPTGLYAAENADGTNGQRARHLIFLTDGQTEPYDLAYGAYGIEGLDRRRWNPSSTLSLADTVEARFGVACAEVKKRNITVWVIAFGTYLNDAMVECAGNGQYFEAANADDLNNAFTSIARSIGDLRLSK
ncbi:TadE/TadG family protein [Altererythrobacter sp. RZ02]|uniref:TadE/TadG family protein n=1 Tax=Pontixanthobacter rizhaonensis TaxID=2730337 RepID=A0A848QQS5_9SPHN|nr:TadE/TadG family type IV pilus assembly protein [Pontixanthobacter rizhaonensis]NMW31458.1 TadE/TadG family protein [Pontixanthobacter rizhaonensis]